MKNYLAALFKRDNSIRSFKETFSWWERGRGFLNLLLIIYLLIYFAFYLFILGDGFIILLLPAIFYNLVFMNILFTFGFIFEMLSKILKFKLDFNVLASDIKFLQFILIVGIFIALSIFNFPSEWMMIWRS